MTDMEDELANAPKSYVSILNEIAVKRRQSPVYELVSTEGLSHDPTFVFKVSIDDVAVNGRGRRKKDARQDAARALLMALGEKIVGEFDTREIEKNSFPDLERDEEMPDLQIKSFDSSPVFKSENGGKVKETTPIPECKLHNPVGSLQEMTMFMRWPPPQFKLERQVGPPHDAIFTMACNVWDEKTIGTGKSKKEAKRLAALAMYNFLRYNRKVIQEWRKREGMAAGQFMSMHMNGAATTNIGKVPIIPKSKSKAIKNQVKLRHSNKRSVQELRKIGNVLMMPYPLELLQDLATDHKFDLFLQDIHQPNCNPTELSEKTQDHVAYLRLPGTKPEIQTFGLGSTRKVAREAACRFALHNIKLYVHNPPLGDKAPNLPKFISADMDKENTDQILELDTPLPGQYFEEIYQDESLYEDPFQDVTQKLRKLQLMKKKKQDSLLYN